MLSRISAGRSPAAVPASSRGPMAALCLGALSYALAQTAIAPALSSMSQELDRTPADVAWVVTAYFVAAAVLTPVLGRLGDLFGKRQVLVATLVLFGVGSAVSAVAPTLELIVVGRILQGAGGGIFPLAFGIVRDVVPQHRVASAVGTVSALTGVGAGAGLVLGGVVSDALGYRFVFWAGALPAIAAAVLAHRVLPAHTVRAPGRVDVIGALGLAVGLALPLLAMTQGVRWGWASPTMLGMLGVGLLVLVLWTVRTRRVDHPLIDLATMRRPQVRRTNIATFLTSISMYVPFLLIPSVAQAPTSTAYGLGLGATAAGLLLVPGSVLSLASGPLTGLLVRRRGTRVPLLIGAGLQGVGLLALATTHGSVTTLLLLAPVVTFGTGMAFAAMPNLIFESVSPEQSGQATGVNAVVRTIGVAVGAQITAVLLAAFTTAATGLPDDRAITAAFAAGGAASLLGCTVALSLARRRATSTGLPTQPGGVAVPAASIAARRA